MPVVFNQRPGTYSAWDEHRMIHFGTYASRDEAQKRLEECEMAQAVRQRKLYEARTGKKLRGRVPNALRKQKT